MVSEGLGPTALVSLLRVKRAVPASTEQPVLNGFAGGLFGVFPPKGWANSSQNVLSRLVNDSQGPVFYLGVGGVEMDCCLGELMLALSQAVAQGYRDQGEFFRLAQLTELHLPCETGESGWITSEVISAAQLRDGFVRIREQLTASGYGSGPASLVVNVDNKEVLSRMLADLLATKVLTAGSLVCLCNGYSFQQDAQAVANSELVTLLEFCSSNMLLLEIAVASKSSGAACFQLGRRGTNPRLILDYISKGP